MAYTEQDLQEILKRYDIKDRNDVLFPTAAELILKVENDYDCSAAYGELFVKNGVLYENHSSHCSCHGCEEQWEPEDTLLAAIKLRPCGFEGVPFEEVEALMRAAGYTGD
jgi:hypothetical protein